MAKLLAAVLHDRSGATAIEYTLLATLIAVSAIVALEQLGGAFGNLFATVDTTIASKV